MSFVFTTRYSEILERIESLDPILYGKTRNYTDGAVTRLSPYISRGVISTKQVLESVKQRGYAFKEIEIFVKELAWRDYFQLIWQEKPEDFNWFESLDQGGLPKAVLEASTGIHSIDQSIIDLEQTGYMHNHCRMYTAALVCNIARLHWLLPAKWMYFHLLDGDWGSNAGSWRWVAGSNGGKKYVANQENINRYTASSQLNTFLDIAYEDFENMEIPEVLLSKSFPKLKSTFPEMQTIKVDPGLPTLIYNYYNLDPNWHKGNAANRIFLLEPDLFEQLPVSKNCIDFSFDLALNIPEIQMYLGSFQNLKTTYNLMDIRYKEHPLNSHYQGVEEPREWISSKVKGYFPSFFSFWRKLEKEIKNDFNNEIK